MLQKHDYIKATEVIDEYYDANRLQENTTPSEIRLIYFVASLKTSPLLGLTKVDLLNLKDLTYSNQDLVSCEIALIEILNGNPLEALKILDVIPENNKNGTYFSRLGTANLLIGNYSDALYAYQQAIILEPDLADHYNNLGGALVRLQRLEEALTAYGQCLNIQPNHVQANQSNIEISAQLNRGEDIISELYEKAEKDPESIEYNLALFNTLKRFNKEAEAIEMLVSKFDDFKNIDEISQSDLHESSKHLAQVNYRLNIIDLLVKRSQHKKALALTNQIFAFLREPSDSLITLKSNILSELGFYKEAMTLLGDIKDCNSARKILAEASIYSKQGNEEKALECLSAIEYDDKNILSMKARLYLQLGNLEASHDCMLKLANNNILAFAELITSLSYKPSQEIVDKLIIALGNPLLPDETQITVNFALSDVYKNQNDLEESFKYLTRANQLISKTVKYQPKIFTLQVNANINNVKPETFLQREKLPKSKPIPIFIVGMPRSGTTLTETIIGAHPDVYPCGELDTFNRIIGQIKTNYQNLKKPYPLCISDLSRKQLISMANAYIKNLPDDSKKFEFITDKLPHNFMNVGLIHLLFPESPIIHVMRDPRDTGLSNYQQNFAAKYGGMGYSCDLEHIGKQINDYNRIMHHWRSIKVPMFEFWYEDLVSNQELMTRELLRYCGLPWNKATMSFHELERSVRTASVSQVRQKMYKSSSKKWKRFEKELQPLIKSLNKETVMFYSSDRE